MLCSQATAAVDQCCPHSCSAVPVCTAQQQGRVHLKLIASHSSRSVMQFVRLLCHCARTAERRWPAVHRAWCRALAPLTLNLVCRAHLAPSCKCSAARSQQHALPRCQSRVLQSLKGALDALPCPHWARAAPRACSFKSVAAASSSPCARCDLRHQVASRAAQLASQTWYPTPAACRACPGSAWQAVCGSTRGRGAHR